jgi:hypothetical protein
MGGGGVSRVRGGCADGVPVKKAQAASAPHAIRAVSRLTGIAIDTLWAGKCGAERYASIITPRGLVLHDYHTYQQELVRLGGRVE